MPELSKNLEDKLKVGTKIRLGPEFCKQSHYFKLGDIIELVEGFFEYDNGLYTDWQDCPSIWNEDMHEFDSIYHLFENDLSGFLDCEIIE